MAEEVRVGKVTSDNFDDYMTPLTLDLIAAFNVLQDSILKVIEDAEKNNKTADTAVKEIEDLF
jgi:hypothetical protein